MTALHDVGQGPAASKVSDIKSQSGRAGRSREAAFAVGCLVYFLLFGMAAQRMLNDPDTFWHIRSGQQILATWSFPVLDQWSFTATGEPWIAKEWLSQVFLALAYDAGGWNGVVGLSAFVTALAFPLLTWFASRRFPLWLCCFCVAAAFILTSSHFLARPHVFSYPIIVVWFAWLAQAWDGGRAPHWSKGLLLILWANLHGGFTLGLVFAFGFAAAAIWESWDRRWQVLRDWAPFLAVSLLSLVVTPYGVGSALITVKLLSFGPSLTTIIEWNPPNFGRDSFKLLVFLIWTVLALTSSVRLSLPRAGMIAALLYLFFTATRNSELLGLVLPFLVPPQRPAGRSADLASGWWPPAVVSLVALVSTVAIASHVRAGLVQPDDIRPASCLAFAREHGLADQRVLNSYEFGGFLIWEGMKTYIDGRAELFGTERLDAYTAMHDLKGEDPLRPLDRDAIAWTLFNPIAPVGKAMDTRPGWSKVFSGPECVVHVRQGKL